MWRSLAAHLLWEQGVAGSNPAIPTASQGAADREPTTENRRPGTSVDVLAENPGEPTANLPAPGR